MISAPLAAILVVATAFACAADREADLTAFSADFASWAPPINGKLSFKQSPWGTGVFVEAPAGVRTMEPVMAVPMGRVLCTETIAGRPYGPILAKVPEADAIALAVVVEEALGVKSRFHSWIRVVPRIGPDMSPPATWPQSELDRVEPKSYRADARRTDQQLRDDFRRIQTSSNVVKNLESWIAGETDASDTATGNVITVGAFRWARTLIDTRAWNVNGRKYFVPGADMFNHAPDAEDMRYDPLKRPLQQSRSQKFVRHHQVGMKNEATFGTPEPVAVVYSDRTVSVRGAELHESYGDNTDFIYFNYHGFVPASPEEFTPAERESADKVTLKNLTAAWRQERVKRNAWDTQPVPSQLSGWEPLSASTKPGERRDALLAKLRIGNATEPVTVRKTKANTDREAALRRKREKAIGPWLAKRVPRAMQQQVALVFGELDPVLEFLHVAAVMPEHVTSGSCFQAVAAPTKVNPTGHGSLKKTFQSMTAGVLKCADGEPVLKSDDVVLSQAAWHVIGLRSMKRALKAVADTEFPLNRLRTDLDMETIRGALATLERKEDAGVMAAATVSERHSAVIRLTRGRLGLERRMILREAMRRLDKKIRKLASGLAASHAAAVDLETEL